MKSHFRLIDFLLLIERHVRQLYLVLSDNKVSNSDNGYSWKQMPGLINQMKSDIAYYYWSISIYLEV
jgi:hypothetical protein